VCVGVCVRMYVFMYGVCMYVFMYGVCMYVYVCVYVCMFMYGVRMYIYDVCVMEVAREVSRRLQIKL